MLIVKNHRNGKQGQCEVCDNITPKVYENKYFLCADCALDVTHERIMRIIHKSASKIIKEKEKEKENGNDTMATIKQSHEKYCHECGEIIRVKAEICPKCGVRQPDVESTTTSSSKFTGKPGEHKCINCGYQGKMKTWLGNYMAPQVITLLLLLFYIVPGIIYMIVFWNKNKCPKCGAVGKTINT
ncbi:hypothetical protein [uncultured Gammaproteobacteria bacterium]|jgi:RNA polymerase subunit RPABC4/transcription elongation factor Spt4|uniref:DZANK-type domain-containing protein n=1 Tax=Bathymodiolus thermophilus thioautotrophic gill symbiont TaxID=2360 RepID=A0ABM8MBH5_9GAMM|nr:hypothetical protein [Bathymodiolus thermophilus thioautotrophic gill symbiont]CAC5842916.1 hypothetical protein [uncultured Gammaproteobacteria bacterium]CAB5507887.1 hypothetical protein AZO1586I_2162 [Bathymodiolus thermophilus thioautotrophic gill symbiont]CAC9494085.1 hypothetical protein [uncultured Gammaproteobacteria bacterium]CAC9513955.1 hypothetical protein [uncultured Gammaproteobacteria bacterium]CAC9521129.1 hypothetical protein [uncultured Gammaproteobacteria bacterium]